MEDVEKDKSSRGVCRWYEERKENKMEKTGIRLYIVAQA